MSGPSNNELAVVVGAGIGGLTAALALMREGVRVTVLEQAPAFTQIGAGVQLTANATRVLSLLGLEGSIATVGLEPKGKVIRHWSSGRTWEIDGLAAGSREKYGHPHCMIHRADLHAVLERAVRRLDPAAIRLDSRCIAVDMTGDRPAVILATGERVVGDLVVGADGVHSRVRIPIAGPDCPNFSGFYAWRGIIPTERLPAHLHAPVGANWVGPGRHVIHYPLRRGELTNFVGIVEGRGWEFESWTQRGSLADCLKDFNGWHDDVQAMIRAIDTHYKWAFMVREPNTRWSSSRVTLLGDAAHPTLPFLGQGAAMAMEDGYILARAFAVHRCDPNAALTAYEAARMERTARVVHSSRENAARIHNPALADAVTAQKYIHEQWAENRVRQRYEWLFDYRADEVPV
jgi:salicylate hydroxylase